MIEAVLIAVHLRAAKVIGGQLLRTYHRLKSCSPKAPGSAGRPPRPDLILWLQCSLTHGSFCPGGMVGCSAMLGYLGGPANKANARNQ